MMSYEITLETLPYFNLRFFLRSLKLDLTEITFIIFVLSRFVIMDLVRTTDLVIVTNGKNTEEAKQTGIKVIKINLEAYSEVEKDFPERESVTKHLENSDFAGLLFAYVNVYNERKKAAV